MGFIKSESSSFRRGSEEVMNFRFLFEIWCGFYCFLLSVIILFYGSQEALFILLGFIGYFYFQNFPRLLIELFRGNCDNYVLRHL